MTLTKNGITYILTDPTQIAAFLGAGWEPEKPDKEIPADEPDERPRRTTRRQGGE